MQIKLGRPSFLYNNLTLIITFVKIKKKEWENEEVSGVLSLLVLTGCGKKENVVCTMNAKMNGVTVDTTANIYLNGSKFAGMNVEYDIILPESLQNNKQTAISMLEKTYKSYGEKVGATMETTETEKGAKVTLNMTADQAKKYIGSKNAKVTKKELVKEFEKQGFECK